MDAIDVNWCLNCGFHTEGIAYCSRECRSAYNNATTSSSPSQPIPIKRAYHISPPQSFLEDEDEDELELDDEDQAVLQSYHKPYCPPTKGAWVGKGHAGIHAWAEDVIPGPPAAPDSKPPSITSTPTNGFRRPKLLQNCKRPVPTLYTSKTEPAPPVPSRPLTTSQQSLPSVSGRSMANPSLTSLTTAISTSIATPASTSQDYDDPPSAETQRPTFIGTVACQFRNLVSSSFKEPKSKGLRSKTVTRPSEPLETRPRGPQARARSPVSLYPIDATLLREKSLMEKERASSLHPADDHPVFKTRGRKPARVHA